MVTRYKAQLVRSFLCLGLVGGLAGSAQAKNEHTQTVTVGISGIEKGNSEVDRVQVTTNMMWKTGRRENISLTLPWQKISSTSGVGAARGSADASGLMDATLVYQFTPKERGGNLQTRWSLNMNLPIGKDSLTANELSAVTALNAGANSFLNPQFGRGFGAGLRHTWELTQGDSLQTFYVGYNEEGSYTFASSAAGRTENSGVDTYIAGAGRNFTRGRLDLRLGLDAIFFDSSTTTTNGVGQEFESDPNYILSAVIKQQRSDRLSFNYNLNYQFRDQQDALSPGIAVAPTRTELGNRFFWSATAQRTDAAERGIFELGVAGVHTGPSTRFANPGPRTTKEGSADELYGRVGYTRNLRNNGSWNVRTDIGLTSDARDYAVTGGYQRKF